MSPVYRPAALVTLALALAPATAFAHDEKYPPANNDNNPCLVQKENDYNKSNDDCDKPDNDKPKACPPGTHSAPAGYYGHKTQCIADPMVIIAPAPASVVVQQNNTPSSVPASPRKSFLNKRGAVRLTAAHSTIVKAIIKVNGIVVAKIHPNAHRAYVKFLLPKGITGSSYRLSIKVFYRYDVTNTLFANSWSEIVKIRTLDRPAQIITSR